MSESKAREAALLRQVSMVIQCTRSIPALDSNNAFQKDENGDMCYEADSAHWQPLLDHDIPVWVTSPDVIAAMAEGTEVNWAPNSGGRWYRGIVCALNPGQISKAVH